MEESFSHQKEKHDYDVHHRRSHNKKSRHQERQEEYEQEDYSKTDKTLIYGHVPPRTTSETAFEVKERNKDRAREKKINKPIYIEEELAENQGVSAEGTQTIKELASLASVKSKKTK